MLMMRIAGFFHGRGDRQQRGIADAAADTDDGAEFFDMGRLSQRAGDIAQRLTRLLSRPSGRSLCRRAGKSAGPCLFLCPPRRWSAEFARRRPGLGETITNWPAFLALATRGASTSIRNTFSDNCFLSAILYTIYPLLNQSSKGGIISKPVTISTAYLNRFYREHSMYFF